jgi:predicted MFS family arabinose efflux permease
MPLLMLVFAFVRNLTLALIIIVGIGWSFILLVNTTNAIVQSLAKDELRGRVMGVYTLIFFGASPIGSLLTGWLAAGFGEPPTVIITSVLLLLFAVMIWMRRPEMRMLE